MSDDETEVNFTIQKPDQHDEIIEVITTTIELDDGATIIVKRPETTFDRAERAVLAEALRREREKRPTYFEEVERDREYWGDMSPIVACTLDGIDGADDLRLEEVPNETLTWTRERVYFITWEDYIDSAPRNPPTD